MRMPLNSKRLKAGHLRRLAAALGVPTAASADELRQMIDGKLTEEGKEVRNVQVVLGGADPTSEFALEDEEGRFLIVHATEEENRSETPNLSGDGEEQDANILKRELDTLAEENQSLKAEVSGLKDKLHEEKARIRDLWRTNCQCMAEYDDEIAAKDNEIEELRHQLSSRLEVHSVLPHTAETRVRGDTRTGEEPLQPLGSRARRGKAPPVDPFTGENLEIRIDEWLPSLERARAWNDWTEEELLLQLAGHLRGRALQEWGLLNADSKRSYVQAVDALRLRLDPGSRTLAAQDFRHTSQTDEERVADFIRRLERTFNVAYGREGMSSETRDTLLHGQLQDGLKHELMRAPAVSGAQSYPELCLAARNEEKRLAELKKRQQYLKPSATPLQPMKEFTENKMFVPQVRLVQSLRLFPHQGASVSVQLEPVSRLQVTGEQSGQGSTQPMVKCITEEEATQRKQTLSELVGQPQLLTPEQAEQLHQLLGEHHAAFCLEPNERGETDTLSMEIDTGGAPPKKQAARRMPFAVKPEVSKQLRTMQEAGVMQPSNSSWASPVVMVRKRDRTHRFCVD